MDLEDKLYNDEGMYVHCENGTIFNFSRKNVARLADEYWNSPEKLSDEIRHNEFFKTCSVCPYRGKDVMCSSIKPLLPFLENLNDFKSFDPVTLLFRDENGVVSIKKTDMQNALQYLTDISVFQYCEDMKIYKEYYLGIKPLQSTTEKVQVLLLNIFWKSGGDKDQTRKTIKELQKAIDITTRNCIKRLHLICRSDAFKNAYVKTHNLGNLIAGYSEKFLAGKQISQ